MTDDDPRARVVLRLERRLGHDEARQTLTDLGQRAALRYLDDCRRRRTCRQMLDAKETVRGVCRRLTSMGLSESSAYRLIDSVLSQRGDELAERRASIQVQELPARDHL